jgi:poly-beta-1,6-N-acetyl-D-glucosamine synthase
MKANYVLITATWNEEKYIHHTIDAVLSQTIRPVRWVIVSDGSTDRTDYIVREAAANNEYVVYVRKERSPEQKGFASKVYAIHEGLKHLTEVEYSFIGHLDGDVSFAPDYYEQMLKTFHDRPHVGIGGGFIFEQQPGQFRNRPSNTPRSVAGAIQLFRRECYEAIDGLRPLEHGGEDWLAEIMARMKGWDVEADPTLIVHHLKRGFTARGLFAENLRQGRIDFSLGSHPLFELAKCGRRLWERPYVIGALIRLGGFLLPYVSDTERCTSPDVIRFLRKEQLNRLLRLK